MVWAKKWWRMLSKIESLELAKQKKKQLQNYILQTYQHSTVELINTHIGPQ